MSKNKKQRNKQKKISTPNEVHQKTILQWVCSWTVIGVIVIFLLGTGVAFMIAGWSIIADIFYVISGILFIFAFCRWEVAKQHERKRIIQVRALIITTFVIIIVIIFNHNYFNMKSSELFSQSFPGFSFHALIKLNDVSSNHRKYIVDIGKVNGSRLSVYISSDNVFTFSFIDAVGEPHNIQLPIGSKGVPFGKQFYLICELGIDGQSTLLRMLIDGKEIKSIQLPFKVDYRNLDVPGGVIGADLNGENGASFDLYSTLLFETTLTSSAIDKLTKFHFKWHQPSGQCFAFNGKQWMRINRTGRRDFVQNNPSLQPTIMK